VRECELDFEIVARRGLSLPSVLTIVVVGGGGMTLFSLLFVTNSSLGRMGKLSFRTLDKSLMMTSLVISSVGNWRSEMDLTASLQGNIGSQHAKILRRK
jgi:hypothetical protein